MATIGQILAAPESGWQRCDNTDGRIIYTGSGWTSYANASNYGGSYKYTQTINDTIKFVFYGTKLRLIMLKTSTCSGNIKIVIDGSIIETINGNSVTSTYQVLTYEKLGLTLGLHTIVITAMDTNITLLDAIDIDDTGYLEFQNGLHFNSNLLSMIPGDAIPCRYTALTTGVAGYFSELGTCVAPEIPIAGTATPDGLFYFIKNDKGMLIADRVIQTNISWDALNAAKFIEGSINYISKVPVLKADSSQITHSSVYSATYDAWKAFDGLYGEANRWLPMAYPEWLAYDFQVSTKLLGYSVNGYTGGTTAPKSFTLQGWNGISWIIIDTRLNEINWASQETRFYTIQNPGSYTQYKIEITADNGYGRCGVGELKFFDNVLLIRSLSGGCAYVDYNQKRIVSLLLHFDGVNGNTTFIDNSPTPKTITPYGTAQISTTKSKFGLSSTYLSSGNYLKIGAHPDLNVGTGDYTIDFNTYLTAISSDQYFMDAFSVANKWAVEYYNNQLRLIITGTAIFAFSCSIVANTWYHIEITRKSGIMYAFLNGALLGSIANSLDHSINDDLVIGAYGGTKLLYTIIGYIDEFRIIKGTAENTTTFTPSTLAYVEPTNTFTGPFSSTVDQGLGAYPNINEWDKYIVNSTLNGKITPGDNNIWNWKTLTYGSWVKDTPVIGIIANTNRGVRGSTTTSVTVVNGFDYFISSTVSAQLGFRPVFEYLEVGSKATTLFY